MQLLLSSSFPSLLYSFWLTKIRCFSLESREDSYSKDCRQRKYWNKDAAVPSLLGINQRDEHQNKRQALYTHWGWEACGFSAFVAPLSRVGRLYTWIDRCAVFSIWWVSKYRFLSVPCLSDHTLTPVVLMWWIKASLSNWFLVFDKSYL